MKNLKSLRKKQGYTCESLGKVIGVQKSAVSKYERGDIQPSHDILKKLAKTLNTTTDYLLEIADDPAPFNNKVSLEDSFTKGLTGLEKNILADLIAMDNNLRRAVIVGFKAVIDEQNQANSENANNSETIASDETLIQATLEESHLIDNYRILNEEGQELATDYIEYLASSDKYIKTSPHGVVDKKEKKHA